MSSFLFNFPIDWILKNTTAQIPRGIRWTPFTMLENLDFTDNINTYKRKVHN